MRLVPAAADRLLVVLSDVEMGAGGAFDDFPHSDFLAELIAQYGEAPYDKLRVDLVFNGDTFDFLKTSVDETYTRHVTKDVALAKLGRVLNAHPAFVRGVRAFLDGGQAPRQVHFIAGNHDLELLFPSVQRALVAALDRSGVRFHPVAFEVGDVRVEHGSQGDTMFRIDERNPFTMWQGRTILDLPWGSVAIIDVLLPMQRQLHTLDRVKPRQRVFELLPEFRELMGAAFWRYWTRDYLRDMLNRSDPMRRVNWTMLKEVMYRFRTYDTSLSAMPYYRDRARELDRFRVWVVGHQHSAGWWSFADRKVLQLGCFRDEFAIDRAGWVTRPIPKVYAEIFLARERAIRSELVEVEGPPAPEGHVPESILDLRDHIRPLLEPEHARRAIAVAEQAQVQREAAEGDEE